MCNRMSESFHRKIYLYFVHMLFALQCIVHVLTYRRRRERMTSDDWRRTMCISSPLKMLFHTHTTPFHSMQNLLASLSKRHIYMHVCAVMFNSILCACIPSEFNLTSHKDVCVCKRIWLIELMAFVVFRCGTPFEYIYISIIIIIIQFGWLFLLLVGVCTSNFVSLWWFSARTDQIENKKKSGARDYCCHFVMALFWGRICLTDFEAEHTHTHIAQNAMYTTRTHSALSTHKTGMRLEKKATCLHTICCICQYVFKLTNDAYMCWKSPWRLFLCANFRIFLSPVIFADTACLFIRLSLFASNIQIQTLLSIYLWINV